MMGWGKSIKRAIGIIFFSLIIFWTNTHLVAYQKRRSSLIPISRFSPWLTAGTNSRWTHTLTWCVKHQSFGFGCEFFSVCIRHTSHVVFTQLSTKFISFLHSGISEYLFLNEEYLQDAIQAALYDKDIREDDMEFMMSARGWQECIALGNMEGYRMRFEDTSKFFQDRFGEAAVVGKQMIEMITRKTTHTKK